MSDERIFRTIIHALRHDPWKYGLELDEAGFASIDDLVTGLRFDRYDWALLERADLERILHRFGVARFKLRDGRVRVSYGHTIELGTLPPLGSPPELLFHGTTEKFLPVILREGLKPMCRRFVHLTTDRQYALRVANARQGSVVLDVLAGPGKAVGLAFRQANEHVWLIERVQPIFLSIGQQGIAKKTVALP